MYETTIKINGMACEMCEAHIKDEIRKLYPNAKKVKASHIKNLASFVTEEEPDSAKVKAAIDNTGYHFMGMDIKPAEEKKSFSLFGRKKLDMITKV